MAKKLLCYLVFVIVETLIVLSSIVVVVCLYIPFVILKGIVMTVTGKAAPRVRTTASIPSTNA